MPRDIPDWCIPLKRITRDDVIRGGACTDGVDEWIAARGNLKAVMPVKALLKDEPQDQSYIAKAAQIDGYGSGDGSGYGDGYGDGSGDGYGYGDGDGSGYGYGDGDGYGDGYGYGE